MVNPTYAFWVGVCAGLLTVTATVPYTLSIFRGNTKPNQVTWGVWSLVQLLLTTSYWKVAGERWAIWVSIAYTLITVWVWILSLWYGEQCWDYLDVGCLTAAVALVFFWGYIGSSSVLVVALCIDVCGALPTMKKAVFLPQSEDCTAWVIGFSANSLNLFAVTHWDWRVVYPIYLYLMTGFIMTPLLGFHLRSCFSRK